MSTVVKHFEKNDCDGEDPCWLLLSIGPKAEEDDDVSSVSSLGSDCLFGSSDEEEEESSILSGNTLISGEDDNDDDVLMGQSTSRASCCRWDAQSSTIHPGTKDSCPRPRRRRRSNKKNIKVAGYGSLPDLAGIMTTRVTTKTKTTTRLSSSSPSHYGPPGRRRITPVETKNLGGASGVVGMQRRRVRRCKTMTGTPLLADASTHTGSSAIRLNKQQQERRRGGGGAVERMQRRQFNLPRCKTTGSGIPVLADSSSTPSAGWDDTKEEEDVSTAAVPALLKEMLLPPHRRLSNSTTSLNKLLVRNRTIERKPSTGNTTNLLLLKRPTQERIQQSLLYPSSSSSNLKNATWASHKQQRKSSSSPLGVVASQEARLLRKTLSLPEPPSPDGRNNKSLRLLRKTLSLPEKEEEKRTSGGHGSSRRPNKPIPSRVTVLLDSSDDDFKTPSSAGTGTETAAAAAAADRNCRRRPSPTLGHLSNSANSLNTLLVRSSTIERISASSFSRRSTATRLDDATKERLLLATSSTNNIVSKKNAAWQQHAEEKKNNKTIICSSIGSGAVVTNSNKRATTKQAGKISQSMLLSLRDDLRVGVSSTATNLRTNNRTSRGFAA